METVGFWHSDGEGPGHARDAMEVEETVGVWECKNIIFYGCKVMSGTAKAVVIKTGADTALGVVARVRSSRLWCDGVVVCVRACGCCVCDWCVLVPLSLEDVLASSECVTLQQWM